MHRPIRASTWFPQLNVQQDKRHCVESDVTVQQVGSELRPVEEPIMEGDTPRGVVDITFAPHCAGIIDALGEGGCPLGAAEADVVEDVVDADKEGDRVGLAPNEIADVEY